MFTLSDLLVEYPSIDSVNLQTKISAKKEFNELASPLYEVTPIRGQLYNHQQLFLRYMRVYNEMFITDATGTGKAISMASITEYLKHQHLLSLGFDTQYDIINGHFKRAIVLIPGLALKKEFLKQLVCKASDDYTVSKIKLLYPDSTMKVKKLIKKAVEQWYQFHTYGMFTKMLKKLEPDQIKQNYNHSIIVIDEAHNLLMDDNIDAKLKADKNWDKNDIYKQLKLFFETIEYSKKILVTATPMLNTVEEVGTLFNLILPVHKQFNKDVNYERITVEELNAHIAGRVTYIKSLNSGAVREDQGKNGLFESSMSRYQSQIYKEMYETHGGKSWDKYLAYAANFVFPDGVVTEGSDSEEEGQKGGYYRYVIKKEYKGTKRQFVYDLNKKEKDFRLDDLDDVKKYSCKYYSILKSLEAEGSVFIYGKYNVGSGNIMLGLCLEKAGGYERFMETESVFEKGDTVDDMCFVGSSRQLKSTLKKKKRYALLTGETIHYDAAFEAIMELMNSYENRHGEYLKCVIASRVARDGLNFRNILAIHLIEPDYNPSTMYQAISRGIRSGSHDDLLKINPNLKIKVYRHVAIPNKKIFDIKEWIVDLRIYKTAEEKSIKIEMMLNKLRQCVIGCQINKERNQINTCIDPQYTSIDYSTYNAYYIEEAAQKLIPNLLSSITTLNHFTIKDLKGEQNELLIALNFIILNKIPIPNRYGFFNYLYENKGYYFLSPNYHQSDSTDTLYTNQIVVTNDTSDAFFKTLDERHYASFNQLTEKEDIEQLFDALIIDNKIKVLEEQFINKDPKYDFLIQPYLNFFYKMNEYKVSDVNIISKKTGSCVAKEVKTGKFIYINLLNLLRNTNKHGLVQDYLKAKTKLRIYNNNNWVDATDCENELYVSKIVFYNNDLFNQLKVKYDYLFGLRLGGDVLIVYDKKEKKNETVGRGAGRGKNCDSFVKEDIIAIANKLKISKQLIEENDKIIPLCQLIRNKLMKDQRLFLVKNDY